MKLLKLPRTSLWNLAEMDRDYKRARLPFKVEAVIDIGAHAGIFALWVLGEYPSARLECYEPHPQLAALCRENLEGLATTVHEKAVIGLEDHACIGPDGRAPLHEGRRTLLGTSLHQLGWQKEEVAARVEWVPAAELPPCDMLKVDTDGSDIGILRDYTHGRSVSALLCEVHRRSEFEPLMQLAWGWGLEMTRCHAGRNGCVTSVWVRPLVESK